MALEEPKKYNVLVLGETQSGKSTLIEHIRKYADPNVVFNPEAIGSGFLSHTQKVTTETVITDLPEYYVSNKKNGTQVNYGEFIMNGDEYDFEDSINTRRNLESMRGRARLQEKAKFSLIDTPGLNATGGDDEKHVQGIFGKLVETKTIHLLIITISSGPFTQGLQDAIKCYVDMFPAFNGVIAFVHTHFDYKNFHPQRTQMSNAIELRMERLHNIMGRTTFPHFKIDCDMYNKKPIRDCITQNTIQKILELATFNQPVNMLHTVINKTRKMRDIDNILKDKFEATSRTIEKTLRFKVPEEGDLLTEIFRRETRIHKLEAKIKVLDEFLVRHDADVPEILHEDRLDMDFETKKSDKYINIRFPETKLDFAITNRNLLLRNVTIIKETGSKEQKEDWKYWEGKFERTSPQNSVLHVKIYTAKANRYQVEILQRREERMRLKSELEVTVQHRDHHANQNEAMKATIKEIVESHSEGIQILGFVANEYLTPDIFQDLMEEDVYKGDTAACAIKVQKVYMKRAKNQPKPHSQPKLVQPIQDASAIEVAQDFGPPTTEKSILFLGDVQSGKSTLIEHLKHYADSSYMIDHTLLGDGFLPKAIGAPIRSNLPPYQLFRSNVEVDLDRMIRENVDLQENSPKDDSVNLKPGMSYLDDMPFSFLDTPDLCDHNGEGFDNSKKIINEVLSSRSLNLILIAVNFQSPLTPALEHALQYYSKVLEGLHNKIAFVFTHAGYGEYRLANSRDRLEMTQKVNILRKIFRGSVSDDKESYPTFAVGLTENSIPAVQCLDQNTLRYVLMQAASHQPSEAITREKIESVPYASYSDDQQRKKDPAFEGPGYQPEANDQSAPSAGLVTGKASFPSFGDIQFGKNSWTDTTNLTNNIESEVVSTEEHSLQEDTNTADETFKAPIRPRYSVLILSKTHAGKSALIEHIKQYKPRYEFKRPPAGNTSQHDMAESFLIHSDLPVYEVVEAPTGMTCDPGMHLGNEDNHRALLYSGEKDNWLNFVPKDTWDPNHSSTPEHVEFTFLKSHGFDNINRDEDEVLSVDTRRLSDMFGTEPFNLLLGALSAKTPITKEYMSALEAYAKIIQGKPKVGFLYTVVEPADQQKANTRYHSYLAWKHDHLNTIFDGGHGRVPMNSSGSSACLDMYEYAGLDTKLLNRPEAQYLSLTTLGDILRSVVAKENSEGLGPGQVTSILSSDRTIQADSDGFTDPASTLQVNEVSSQDRDVVMDEVTTLERNVVMNEGTTQEIDAIMDEGMTQQKNISDEVALQEIDEVSMKQMGRASAPQMAAGKALDTAVDKTAAADSPAFLDDFLLGPEPDLSLQFEMEQTHDGEMEE